MRILHTSDWHLGRQLHGLDLGDAQAGFIDHLVSVVRSEGVDVVLISGDVHDRALPALPALQLFAQALAQLRDAGAVVVVISGNHDAAVRLGDKAELLDPRIHLRTDPTRVGEPLLVTDEHGPVAVYAIPYLEPAVVGDVLPGTDGEETGAHVRALSRAMRAVRSDLSTRGARSVLLAHAWVSGGEASESERDLGVGGVARVPTTLFDGIDYTALGHLHAPQILAKGLRYSGSPLPYSFGEARQAKASWLVDLGPAGVRSVVAIPTPVWRKLSSVKGTLEGLLSSSSWTGLEGDVISAVITDARRPMDAMVRLQRRFPLTVQLGFAPIDAGLDASSYAARTRGRSDLDVAVTFLGHVRGEPDDADRVLLAEALESARLDELSAQVGG